MKKLLLPLWLLVIIAFVNLGLLIFHHIALLAPLRSYLVTLRAQPENNAIPGFADWPLEKQLATASVVARADRRLVNGVQQAIISEVLKANPGTEFKYKVGDHFPQGDQRAEQNTEYGEGLLLIFTGPRATLQFIVAIYDGRLATSSQASVEDVKKMIQATAK